MEAWIGEVHSLANYLIVIAISTSDEDIIVILTTDLPSSYETVIISLDTVAPTDLMLNFVITHSINEESQNPYHHISSSKSEEKSGEDAMVCFYCGGTDHFAASCEVEQKNFKAIDTKFAGVAILPDHEDDEVNF